MLSDDIRQRRRRISALQDEKAPGFQFADRICDMRSRFGNVPGLNFGRGSEEDHAHALVRATRCVANPLGMSAERSSHLGSSVQDRLVVVPAETAGHARCRWPLRTTTWSPVLWGADFADALLQHDHFGASIRCARYGDNVKVLLSGFVQLPL